MASAAGGTNVVLKDRAELERLLKSETPCCIVDARRDMTRKLAPLANTVAYTKGMKINPTSVVVVIAESDATAVAVGEDLAKTSGAKDVVAVKGGAATWRSLAGDGGGEGRMSAPVTFVIPKNTCEQEAPIQTLPFKKE
jgi:hypothetical protein